MKKVFNQYAKYYDALNKEKNYHYEINFLADIIKKHNPNARKILDLGCGSGLHANFLADLGYDVVGVDQSEDMIKIANEKLSNKYFRNKDRLKFILGDIRNLQLDSKFDVVVSLFHVLSYLNTNEDVIDGLDTIYTHMNNGAICAYDFWYGPGVLSEKPETRIKFIEYESMHITRKAVPDLQINKNIVNVNYQISIKEKESVDNFDISEQHSMRYFFKPELDQFNSKYKFEELLFIDFKTNKIPDQDSWNALIVNKKM